MKKMIKNYIKKYKIYYTKKHYSNKIKFLFDNNSEIKKHELTKEEKNEIKKVFGKTNYRWHLLYSFVYENFSPYFIPEDLFYSKIECKLNNFKLADAYSDKNVYSFFFDNRYLPKAIIKNINGIFYDSNNDIIDINKASEFLQNKNSNLFIKPSLDTGGGQKRMENNYKK